LAAFTETVAVVRAANVAVLIVATCASHPALSELPAAMIAVQQDERDVD
jgi:hypothetical protein